MPALEPALAHHSMLDHALVEAVKGIKILSALSWPVRVQQDFLAAWSIGRIALPSVHYPAVDFSDVKLRLDMIISSCDANHPIGEYVASTARSWHYAASMLEQAGTPGMGAFSIQLYGKPGDSIAGSKVGNRAAAQHFILAAREILADQSLAEPVHALDAETLKADMERELALMFTQHKVSVVLDDALVSKAAAGPTRIRLRSSAMFSEYDRLQLLHHEAFVHTLTALNGREQPHLASIGMASPRVTATQEGLAVFAELITGSMDISRLNRISQRIIGIDMALGGADFIDVFRFFLDEGQSEGEAFASAMRVFRGAPLSGGTAFTKDAVYLHGLLLMHTFFRYVFKTGQLSLVPQLFAGKIALHDVFTFAPFFANGFLREPLYLPPWVQRVHALAGYLSFSLFANRIRLEEIEQADLRLGV